MYFLVVREVREKSSPSLEEEVLDVEVGVPLDVVYQSILVPLKNGLVSGPEEEL